MTLQSESVSFASLDGCSSWRSSLISKVERPRTPKITTSVPEQISTGYRLRTKEKYRVPDNFGSGEILKGLIVTPANFSTAGSFEDFTLDSHSYQ
jgi:hypothetical protein